MIRCWLNPTRHTDSPNQVWPAAGFPQTCRHFSLIHRFAWKTPYPFAARNPWPMFSQPELVLIAQLLAEPGVTDLVFNGHEHAAVLRQNRWSSVASQFESEEQLARAAKLLIEKSGKRLDLSQPFASANFEKVRVHALLASAVNEKTHLSIRVHASRDVALQQWLSVNRISSELSAQLRQVLASKEGFLISGSAGAGKTTLLRALLCEVEAERIITIEDTAELQLSSQSCVSLLAREANIEGRGEISLNQLLIESLRMRPDRIVIGEVRSAELITLLQASSSGHSAAATIHAASIEQVAGRIESIAISCGVEPRQVARLALNSIRWLVHISNAAGQRSLEIRRNG